ncbi:CpaF family protein [Streptomyces drozdowiczii]|uniref:CpaF/VirB11 family protein n=1 Tax=Streptomyces drozdowiczii TaxID=202862 RepID=A0ABY6Q1U9_9ACTN|nr:CpaF/VirB11 family protein [Streptomyces drozdowiczii]MCX0247993.1 CpaF/VirB11 family protein [Streptomyces drozdowiczii]UZK58255.1 CpaF/VirB11 family protein [Streptomyces drozdowiczii]
MADTHQRPGPAALNPQQLASLLSGHLGQHAAPSPAPPAQAPAKAVAADPGAVPRLAGLPGELPVGWEVIEALQGEVSKALSAEDPDKHLEEADRRALARTLVTSKVAEWATKHAHGNVPLTAEQERAIGTAVFDSMFRGGRLQSLLDEPGVEDVMVDGLRAHVEYHDRPRRTIEKVADSHDELITWVNRMARLSGHGERALTQATPMVGFRMPDGSRVTASLLTSRPSVVIRRHRIRQHGIAELVRWGSINPVLERFLTACVHARMNILVVGDMGAGKTSLLRALGREIPPAERLVTLESDRELYLDEPGPKPGPVTFAFEARQSNGEVRAGDRAGEVSIADMFSTALRYNATRVIVGEVRSTEIVPMLNAMSSGGSGSMCTLHVRRPHAIISRLVQLCTESGMQTEAAHHLIASSIDVVVYLTYLDETAIGGKKHRFVSSIHEVHDVVGEGGRPVTTELFAPQGGEPRAVYKNMPSFIGDLERTGLLRRQWLTDNPYGAWQEPLQTVGAR